MTPEEFTKHLPPFANDTARSSPPFGFKNLSLRVFPLRASLDALQQLCNGYLNRVPEEVGRFRAVVPYTYVALLDYGQISELEMENSVGWFAQAEVYFSVPVEWYQVVNGKWVFRDWGVITPFIYVDDDFSVPLGRTVFGFPKTLARVTKTASDWLKDPFAPVTLARVETLLFPELYTGKPLDYKVFLEVERDAPMSNFRIPADAASPIAPWVIASKLAESMAGFGRDVMSAAQSMRIFEPNPWIDPAVGPAMLNRLMPAFAPGGKGLTLNSLNLKQFRSSTDPRKISFQALTNGRMQMTAFNGAGALGEERIALGDPTGGYTIMLHEYLSLPIARILGLEVHERWRGDGGVDVVSLKPVMPFWASLNVKYLEGTNLAWRTRDGIWYGGNGKPLDPPQTPTPQEPVTDDSSWPRFNVTVTSAADAAIAGPFEFTGATIRVLPLLAYSQKLQKFLDDAVNDALFTSVPRHRLEVWSRPGCKHAYVYMTASSLGTVTSRSNNVGDWANFELSFLIPVKLLRGRKLEGVGLVPAYNFVDSTTAAVSRTEVLGIPTLRAEFVSPQSVWLQEGVSDLGAKQTLLRVDGEVFTALSAGQQAARHPLLEISSRDFAGIGEPDSRATPAEWANLLRSELESKKDTRGGSRRAFKIMRALALEMLGNPSLTADERTDERAPRASASEPDDRTPISLYTLKQFRDARDPSKACYQSLVRVPRVFDEVFDVQEIEETLRVRIYEFPSLQLVEKLGIVAKTVRQDGTGIVYGTQPIRPFSIRGTIHELHGEQLLWRVGPRPGERLPERAGPRLTPAQAGPRWRRPEKGEKVVSLLSDEKRHIKIDLRAARVQDQGDPSQMKSVIRESILRRSMDGEEVPDKGTRQWVRTRKTEPHDVLSETLRRRLQTYREGDGPAKRKKRLEKILERDRKRETWRLSQGIDSTEATEALKKIDPQMVIEAILAREWGSVNDKARWRRGRLELVNRLATSLPGGSAPFAWYHLPKDVTASIDDILKRFSAKTIATKNAPTRRENRQSFQARVGRVIDRALEEVGDDLAMFKKRVGRVIGKALEEARDDFAMVERALYEAIRRDTQVRPGGPPLDPEVDDMIERMREFTKLKLEMDFHFYVLTAGIVSRYKKQAGRDKVTDEEEKETELNRLLNNEIDQLVGVLKRIADIEVIGQPSKTDNVDPRLSADSNRLSELVKSFQSSLKGPKKKWFYREVTLGLRTPGLGSGLRALSDTILGDETTENRLDDRFREAIQLAGRCCEAQRDALLNKLSRAYQKPDFCIRRDCVVSAERSKQFPMSESWDEDWYYGRKVDDHKAGLTSGRRRRNQK